MDRPASTAFDPRTALIVVDMQNDFADPAGSLYVQGGEDVVPVANELITAAGRASSPIFYTQDWHPPVTPHFAKDGGIWPVHCVAGSWGAELHPDLQVVGPVVRKGTGGEDGYSGFSMRDPETSETTATELEGMLREAGVGRLVIVGLATDYCVASTALDARSLGFETTVVGEAIRAVDLAEGDGVRAIERMRHAGVSVVDGAGAAVEAGSASLASDEATSASTGTGH
jgi:nicotinamidase/pyrazinamidase